MARCCALSSVCLAATLVACSSSDVPPRGDAGGTGGGANASGGAPGNGGANSGGRSAAGGLVGSGGMSLGTGGAATGPGGNQGTGGSEPGSGSTPGGEPPTCAASEAGDVASGRDAFVPNSGKREVSAVTYTNVGATGAYAEVVSGWSKATGCVRDDAQGTLCKTEYKREKQVSGALAPFDEEMTLVFAGPVELYQLAVYAPAGRDWARRAYWDRCSTDGLAFVGNKHWYECEGFVQSYVTADGTKESAAPVQFSGTVAAGVEVHVMSSAPCNGRDAQSDCGWTSGVPLHGFAGDAAGSKIFATKLRMPIGASTPAYWILPSQVVRSSQYGCNCRGMGSDPVYKGGCGELDVAEILGGVRDSLEATTTLYSFQDINGGGAAVFNRPVHESATFVVVFDAPSRRIAIRRLGATELDFAGSITSERVAAWLADTGEERPLD